MKKNSMDEGPIVAGNPVSNKNFDEAMRIYRSVSE